MFFVLDTDHMSALEWGSSGVGERLITRLNTLSVGEAATTIVTFEEQTRGWLSVLARSRSLDEQIEAYSRLKRLLMNLEWNRALGTTVFQIRHGSSTFVPSAAIVSTF